MTIAIPDAGASSWLPFYIGKREGLYRKAGINVNIEVLTVPLEVPALLSNKVQFLGAVAVGSEDAVAENPSQLAMKIVDVATQYSLFDIIGAKGITSVGQLVGKNVAVTDASGQETQFLKGALARNGIQPTQYSIALGGNDNGDFTLLQAGKVAATTEESFKLAAPEFKGYPILVKGRSVPSLGAGLVGNEPFMDQHRSLVKKLVSATVAATHIAATDEKVAVAAWKTDAASLNLGYSNAEWKAAWNSTKYVFTSGGRASSSAQASYLQTIQKVVHSSSPPPVGEIFDMSFLPKSKRR